MEAELQEKLDAIDKQIEDYKDLYTSLCDQEGGYKSRIYAGTISDNWAPSTIYREKEIFDGIHKLQESKNRLITGEKLPEKIYVDREVPKVVTQKVIKVVEKPVTQYVDRHTKYVHSHTYKPGFAVSALWFVAMAHAAFYGAIYFDLIDIIVKINR